MHIQIGSANWHSELINTTEELGHGFWNRFIPVGKDGLERLELQINRKLPFEFKEFYERVGYGDFAPGDGFYSPDEIIACLGAPIYFVRGSLFAGQEWATLDQHRQLWISRGSDNPNPQLFTDEIFTLDGIKLYDLLQFGADGSCAYHQLYVGPEPAPFRYCLLTESGAFENIAQSFSEALEGMIESHLPNPSRKAA